VTDFREILKYQISFNPSSGSQVPCRKMDGWTDKQTWWS